MAKKRNGLNCLSDAEVEHAWNQTAERFGKKCFYHKVSKRWKKSELILHHVDGDPENNPKDGSNWRLACRPHHRQLHPRTEGRFNPSRALRIEDLRTSRPATEEMRRNKLAKPLFTEYFNTMMDEFGAVNIDDLCGYVCRESQAVDPKNMGVTSATVERYIDDLVRGKSPYYIDDEKNAILKYPFKAEPSNQLDGIIE